MKKIIRKILKEDRRQMYLDKIVQVMKNDFPFFENMELYGFNDTLSDDEYRYIFKKIFGETAIRRGYKLFNKYGKELYFEDLDDGYWRKSEYNDNGNEIYWKDSDGGWGIYEYDENGNKKYYENDKGEWEKIEYDKNNNKKYYENYRGQWSKWEYDENGKQLYFENSYGFIIDKR